jgi:Ni,Fe-hydrogenase III large subunit/NADH:ubiquinone oxidoreductase subunit C
MKIGDHDWNLDPLGKHIWRGQMETGQLLALARAVKEEGGQLVALWGSDDRHLAPAAPQAHPVPLAPRERDEERSGFGIHVVLLTGAGLAWVSCALPADTPAYPDLAHIFPQADRMQRATFDLLGIRATDAVDNRKWLRHKAWAEDEFPLRKDFSSLAPFDEAQDRAHRSQLPEVDAYPFIRVEGDGVHEIPVGPIHAGTIEPGHFRFSIIGERILRLEQRLGYTHKGTEKRFEGMDLATGAKLAGRVSGDSHSAYAWAYCMAVETATASTVPERAVWLRALFLEIERIANHLGDLGYLGNDVALGFGFMQFWRLKEDWLRLTAKLFGHRYLFDCIVPGGVAVDITDSGKAELVAEADHIEAEVRSLKAIYDDHATLQDRFANTGICKPDLAARLGLTGLAGRASAQAWDARAQFPQAPYDQLDVSMATQRRGDVLARAEVRFAEVYESLRLIRDLLKHLPAGGLQAPLAPVSAVREGLGWVEGWRGEVVVAARIGADGKLDRVHPHDPSWQNWPLVEVGVLGNIVPDFPLINKSFNLSYSGPDL